MARIDSTPAVCTVSFMVVPSVRAWRFSYCQNTYAAGSVAKVYYFTVGENCLGPGTSSYIVSKLSGMEYSASRYANSSKSTIYCETKTSG